MVIEHRLTSTDTLRTLAQSYLGDSNLAPYIADFNGLSYPYIVEDDETLRNHIHGSGYVHVRRTNSRTTSTVSRGWILRTEPDTFNGQNKLFETTQDTEFPEGVSEAFLHIRAVVRGVQGNIPKDTQLVISTGFTENDFALDECITVEQFTGGQTTKLLKIGDYIYIPNESNEITYTDREQAHLFVGEEDIALNEEGELFVDGFGDLASVQGVDNIVQSVRHRLMTERGTLKTHPLYGSNLHYLIGQTQTPYHMKLIELDVYETLSDEDRIRDVQVDNIQLKESTVFVDVTFTLQNAQQMSRSFVLDFMGFVPTM